MAWTPVNKPTSTNYTNVNTAGKTQYDQIDITYNDPSMFYDGVNPTQWTNVLKPVIFGYGNWNGMSMQWQNASAIWDSGGGWSDVSKPI